jgi:uncharacterized membrane protein
MFSTTSDPLAPTPAVSDPMSGIIFVLMVAGLYCLVFAFTRRRICWVTAAILCFSGTIAIVCTSQMGSSSAAGAAIDSALSVSPQFGEQSHPPTLLSDKDAPVGGLD